MESFYNIEHISTYLIYYLLNLIGAEARKIYFKIMDEILDQFINAILDVLKAHCISKRNLVMSQFKIFQQNQNHSKPVDQFYTD